MNDAREDGPRALIVCVSEHHGNTHKVATAMAEALGTEVVEPEEVDLTELHRYDVIGFGSGIYFEAPDKRLARLVGRLPAGAGRAVFTFSTSGAMPIPRMGMSDVRRRLRARGYKVLGDFNCRGLDTVGPLRFIGGLNKGRPNYADLSRAASFAREMQTRATSASTTTR
ncbi:MAG TPA: flavodoxin family protein [Acidimicrobiales bacterium]|nr:flavodoxin family protein [Acidimicrobiales bacterium]